MQNEEFWQRVKELIKARKTTQRGLSLSMGYKERTLETWMNQGTLPDILQAAVMARILGTTVDYLATGNLIIKIETKIPDDLQCVIDKYARR